MSDPHTPDPFPSNTTPKGREFDPHLREVMEEIKEVLRKHRVGGYVALQSPHYAEYLIDFPSWTCIRLHADGNVRIYSKREQFPSGAAQKACMESSVGMVLQFEHILREHADQFASIAEVIGRHIDVFHVSQENRLNR